MYPLTYAMSSDTRVLPLHLYQRSPGYLRLSSSLGGLIRLDETVLSRLATAGADASFELDLGAASSFTPAEAESRSWRRVGALARLSEFCARHAGQEEQVELLALSREGEEIGGGDPVPHAHCPGHHLQPCCGWAEVEAGVVIHEPLRETRLLERPALWELPHMFRYVELVPGGRMGPRPLPPGYFTYRLPRVPIHQDTIGRFLKEPRTDLATLEDEEDIMPPRQDPHLQLLAEEHVDVVVWLKGTRAERRAWTTFEPEFRTRHWLVAFGDNLVAFVEEGGERVLIARREMLAQRVKPALDVEAEGVAGPNSTLYVRFPPQPSSALAPL